MSVADIVRGSTAADFAVVSGGARGIDADAHRAALELGVPQVAVLPCGPDMLYPPEHETLFEAIVGEGRGALLFAHPPGTQPSRGMFASRNRIVVGLVEAVVVVQAARRSGTMITAKEALRQQRPLAVLSGSPGAKMLIGHGATRLDRPGEPDTAVATTRWLQTLGEERPPSSAWPTRLSWLREHLEARGPSGTSVDDLPDPLAAAVALVEAETLGLIVEVAPGRWVCAD